MHRSARSRAFCVAKKFEKIHRDSRKKEGDETARDTILDLPSICFFTREFFMARVNAFQLITMKNSLSFFHLDSLLSSSHSRSPFYYYYYYYFTYLCAPFSPFTLCYFLFFLLGIEKERENSIFILEHLEPGIGFSVNLSIMRHDGWMGNFRSIMRIPNIYIYV